MIGFKKRNAVRFALNQGPKELHAVSTCELPTFCLGESVIYEVLQKTVPSVRIHRSGVKDGGRAESRYIARETV